MRPAGRFALWALLVLFAAATLGAQVPGTSTTLRAEVQPGIVVALDDVDLVLEAVPLGGEGLYAFAERLCGDRAADDTIAAANRGVRRLDAGVRYRVPFSCARPTLQQAAIDALFPGDRPTELGWQHRVGPRSASGEVETLWSIARWFTGEGSNWHLIRQHNALADETIDSGQQVTVPRALLRQEFARRLPAVTTVAAARASARPSSAPGSARPVLGTSASSVPGSSDLVFGRDARGEYAGYRLKPGEALYSSVVVRFTGRLFARDVNPLAHELARRSGISDLTDIPVGYEIKIPLEYLSHQFLPPDDPRRREYDQERSEAARYTNRVMSSDLRGVTIVLDAGHGGRDVGASKGGIWESVYVYDIMERVKRHLAQRTAARVVSTTQDGPSAYRIPERDVLANSQRHQVQTSPPYLNADSRISANLRWALSNSILREERRSGTAESNVVFISIHADSLHSSVRGAMAYVPGLLPLRDNYRLTSEVYRKRKEVREQGAVSFTHKERVKSLGLSRDLAENIISTLRGRGIEIHPNQPVRDRIYRGRRPWVPAVLKYNEVPAKVLVEVCNLANSSDLKLIKTQSFRETFAAALVDGILAYYESGGGSGPTSGG